MHKQLTQPKLKTLGHFRWELVEPYSIHGIDIPAGFITDGASSPFRKLITSWGGHYPIAALTHDWLYDCLNRGKPDPHAPTRRAADKVFRLIMKECGVAPLTRIGMWLAARIAGGALKGLGVR